MRLLASFLALTLALAPCATAQSPAADDAPRPQNVILLIPDGYGPASGTMARDFLRWRDGIQSLALDSIQRGSVRTFATDSRITDSAAGATAFATGTKTYNGAIAVDTTQQPLATLLEAAEARGMATGLVATSRLTHATPASFAAHVPNRWMENAIAEQQLQKNIEVLLGGGRRHFVPSDVAGSEREDDRNLLDEAAQNGYQLVEDATGLDQITEPPVLGLFSMSHMDYEIDRNPSKQPSLADMTQKAIDLVSSGDEGYFLMVEGSRIDHAGHENDAAAHLHDILAFNDAVEVALQHAAREGNTLVVSVSDHETGGLTLGRSGIYAWQPRALAAVTASHGTIHARAQAAAEDDNPTTTPVGVVQDALGIAELSAENQALIEYHLYDGSDFGALLSDLTAARALIGWTSTGHTAVDVTLHAYGPGAERFTGNFDNTYVGQVLAELLNFKLDARTSALREQANTPASESR